MSGKLNSQALALKHSLEKLIAWLEQQPQERFPVPQKILPLFAGWPELSQAFLLFLESKPVPDWTLEEKRLLNYLLRLDWQANQLLKPLPPEKLFFVLSQRYEDQAMRMYMLANLRLLPDNEDRQKIALSLYLHHDADAIRDHALIILAGTGWQQAEDEAKLYWESQDPVKMLVGLNCLSTCNSKLLDHYLDLALQSDEHSLRTVALAIRQNQRGKDSDASTDD